MQTELENETTILDQIKASPLIWFAVAFFGGILLGKAFPIHFYIWLTLAVAVFIFGLIAKRIQPELSLAILLLPGVLFLGGARIQAQQQSLAENAISTYNDLQQHVYVTGILTEAPDLRDKVLNLRLSTEAIDLGEGDIPASGDVLVKLYNGQELAYGDRIRVNGMLVTPPESADFSYRDYLAGQGIHSMLTSKFATSLPGAQPNKTKAWLIAMQDSLFAKTQELFHPPVAALVAGILIGRDQGIPAGVDQAFTDTGTSHIVAISGFNIGIVAFLFILTFGRLFGKRYGTLLSIFGILFYMVLAGAEPSLVRAAIMGVIGAIGLLLGRRGATLTALFLAGMLMALLDPRILWQVGFQLSFSATFGIVTITKPLQDLTRALLARLAPEEHLDTLLSILSDVLIVTFAAQAAVLPFILYHFGRLPLITFLANPLVLPLQPLLMIFSGMAVIFSYIFMPLAQLFALLAHPVGAATISVVEALAPYSAWSINFGNFNAAFVLLYYVAFLALMFAWPTLRKGVTPAILIPAVLLVTFLAWDAVAKLPDGRLHILAMDVGSADALLVTTPSGKTVLINGGETPSALLDQVGRRTSLFDKNIDLLVIASTQENQLAALPRFFGNYSLGQVLWAGNTQASYSSMRLHDLLSKRQVPLQEATTGTVVDLGDGATLRVLAVSSRGAVLRIEMGGFSMLLPIGVNRDSFEEMELGKLVKPATAYYFAESGYAPSNPAVVLAAAQAQYYVLSVSAFDSRGYPSPDLMGSIENPNIFRTDQNGWVEITTDGISTSIQTAR